MKSSVTILVSVLASVAAACGVVLTDRYLNQREAQSAPDAPAEAVRPVVQLQRNNWPDFTFAAETAVDAVVYVKVTVRTGQYDYYGSNDPLFRFFYGDIAPRQREYEGRSNNVIAELPGKRDEWIVLSAHYDTTALSHGSYDNMSGCVGILGVLEALKDKPLNYGLRLVFCGSEERGLLGSKAYTKDHEAELPKIALNVNLDMIGTWLGKFIAKVSAEDKLVHYLSYIGAELSFPVEAKQGVYSSDSTPFSDKGVPALSFARLASPNAAPIHCRYDLPEVLSMAQMEKDIAFIAEFTRRMAMSAVCPVGRDIPEKVKTELDEYLFRKRRA